MRKNKIEFRPLTLKDRKRATRIVSSLLTELGEERLMDCIVSGVEAVDAGDDDLANAGKQAADAIVAVLKRVGSATERTAAEVEEWFADICNMTVEEYQNAPFNIEFRILHYLKTAPEAGGFFTQSLPLASGIRWLRTQYEKAKMKSDSTSE